MVVIGIDPGLNATGYGIMNVETAQWRVLAAGDICPPRRQPLSARLAFLYQHLCQLMSAFRPTTMVLESVFTHQRYVTTAATMAHARGVICLAAQEQGLSLAEYSPARVKKALTGNGNASKTQVARMVSQWLGGGNPAWSADATDALALVIAHLHMETQRQRLPAGAFG